MIDEQNIPESDQRLAAALREVELPVLAERAMAGDFNDFRSDAATPKVNLVKALIGHAQVLHRQGARPSVKLAKRIAAVEALVARVKDGDFDSDKAEADQWFESEDGQQALRKLMEQEK